VYRGLDSLKLEMAEASVKVEVPLSCAMLNKKVEARLL
jgi:hypothetical protein